jgi:hypothetical protein
MAESRKNQSKSSELVCPSCGQLHEGDERFCVNCGMPLVLEGGEEAASPERERARKIDPRYAQGDTVRVAFTRNQAESDLLQNMLLEEGIPSIARRTRGFDVPDFLAAGPRDILVPESGAQLARELLTVAGVGETIEPQAPTSAPAWIVFAVLGGGLLAALIAWLLTGSGAS